MDNQKGSNDPQKDYEIGYKRPPKAYQFQPGQSGNSKGRPKSPKRYPATIKDVIEKVFAQKIIVTEKGRIKKKNALEVLAQSMLQNAIKGSYSYTKLIVQLATLHNLDLDKYYTPQIELTELSEKEEKIKRLQTKIFYAEIDLKVHQDYSKEEIEERHEYIRTIFKQIQELKEKPDY